MYDAAIDRLSHLADQLSVDPPAALIASARAEAESVRAGRRRVVRHRVVIAAVVLAVAIAASLTPPGRAATGWIANIAGFGEDPTLEQVGSVPGSAVVLEAGTLSDGTRFEVVAKRVNFASMGHSPLDHISQLPEDVQQDIRQRFQDDPMAGAGILCLQVDFPDVTKAGQGGVCSDGDEDGRGIGADGGAMYQRPNDEGTATADHDGPGVFVAYVQPDETDHVGVFELHPDGGRDELPAQLVTLDPALLARIGIPGPKAVLITPLDGDTVAAGNRGQIEVRAIAFDATGAEVGHDDVHFMPSSCPDHLPEPEPLSPAGRTPQPLKPGDIPNPQDFDQPFTNVCPPMPPMHAPKMTAYELDDTRLPPSVSQPAALQGLGLAPANDGDYELVHTPGADLANVDDAAHAIYKAEATELGTEGLVDQPTIYLARLVDDQSLVWVVDDTIRAVQADIHSPAAPTPEHRRFIGAVDAQSGDLVQLIEASPDD